MGPITLLRITATSRPVSSHTSLSAIPSHSRRRNNLRRRQRWSARTAGHCSIVWTTTTTTVVNVTGHINAVIITVHDVKYLSCPPRSYIWSPPSRITAERCTSICLPSCYRSITTSVLAHTKLIILVTLSTEYCCLALL